MLGKGGFRVDSNERSRTDAPIMPRRDMEAAARHFIQHEAGFAQVYTINRDGFPVGRTMGAPLAQDWSVSLVQRRVHRRIMQLRRNPHAEVVWVGPPAPDSINDRPHVFDFGLQVPRVVFLRGIAEFMDDAWTLEQYNGITAGLRSRGSDLAPRRTPAQVRNELTGIRIRPIQIRAEGFGTGAQSYTWQIVRST